MVKKRITWKDWWKQVIKAIPLIIVMFIALFAFGVWAFIITSIFAIYIGELYDKEWQKKILF